jgi:hypothetical protein
VIEGEIYAKKAKNDFCLRQKLGGHEMTRKGTKKIQNIGHGLHGYTRIGPLNPPKGDFEDANSLYNHFLYTGVKGSRKDF